MSALLRIFLFTLILLLPFETFAQKKPVVRKVIFEGNATLSDQDLAGQMNTESPTFLDKLQFWKPAPTFSKYTLDDDIGRLKSYYQRNGFLHPAIHYTLDSNRVGRRINVLIQIREGRPYLLRRIKVDDDTLHQDSTIMNEARKDFPVEPGTRFEDRKVYQSEDQLTRTYTNKGYPLVSVKRDIQVDTSTHSVDLQFQVQPGPKAWFGKITFKGDSLVPVKFIRNKLQFSSGDRFSRRQLQLSQQKLFDTELFSYVVVRAQKDSIQGDSIPVTVYLKEKPRWSLQAGVGYGTEDRVRLSAEVTRLHFLGGARRLIFTGKHSHFLPFSFDTKFIQPDIFRDNLDFILNPFYIRENETGFEVNRLGTGVTFQKTFSSGTSGYLMYTLEKDRLTNKTVAAIDSTVNPQDSIHNKSGVTIGVSRNTTKDVFDPTDGWKLDTYITYMGAGFQSEYHYIKVESDVRHYIPFNVNWVFAARLRAGVIRPIKGDKQSPLEDRFLLGGANSLRGWGRNQVSPVNENGVPIGGNSVVEGSAEVRFPVYEIFGGAAFMDFGNVWPKAFRFDIGSLKYDVGLGLRVKTPIGPIRLDLATPVFENKFRMQFFISIGQAF
jgi:outer membrane protein insertion porin family